MFFLLFNDLPPRLPMFAFPFWLRERAAQSRILCDSLSGGYLGVCWNAKIHNENTHLRGLLELRRCCLLFDFPWLCSVRISRISKVSIGPQQKLKSIFPAYADDSVCSVTELQFVDFSSFSAFKQIFLRKRIGYVLHETKWKVSPWCYLLWSVNCRLSCFVQSDS